MEYKSHKTKQIFHIVGLVIGWLALFLQFYLIILNRTASIPETIIRFFSFFTILTNILVALCFTCILFRPGTTWGKFFLRPSTLTALTVYITIVGLIYNTVLRFLWSPQGLQLIVDELLHSVIPVWFVLYWLLFVPKKTLQWKSVLPWMIYPAAYCIYALVRGEISGFYPYPFIDVKALGYYKVFANIGGIVMLFLILSLMVVGLAKLSAKALFNRNV